MNPTTNKVIFGRSVLLFFLFVGMCNTYAQSPTKFLPSFTPPTPEAGALAKYGNYEVNLFTGVPDISIPIYEVKIGEMTIPISINYHPSGIRVNEMPSRVGLGWSLFSGGAINRKVYGKPDELDGNYLTVGSGATNSVQTNISDQTQAGSDYLNSVDLGHYDVQPDLFSYSFPGHNGKYLFNQANNYTPFLIPYAPIFINKILSQNNVDFDITDEGGTNYKFGAKEWTNSGGSPGVYGTSAWLLSEMISANKQDSIHLRYDITGNGITDRYFSEYVTVDDNCSGGDAFTPNFGILSADVGSVSTNWKQLTQIDFKNGKIVFESAPEAREDFNASYSLQNRLCSIKIYNYDILTNSYTILRSFQFFHSYFISGTDALTKRLRLDSMQIKNGNGEALQTYRFTYNTAINLPDNFSTKKDYWGYFNNAYNVKPNGDFTLFPRMDVDYLSGTTTETITIGGSSYTARDANPDYMQANILQKITFPTGGNTQFEYETNKYMDDQGSSKFAGGLRIKSIKNYVSSNSTPIVKTYKYGLNESGYGRNNFLLEQYFFSKTQNYRSDDIGQDGYCLVESHKRGRIFFANPTNDLEGFDGAAVVYPVVAEYIGNEVTNTGKTVYTFSDKADERTSIIAYSQPMFDSYHFSRGLLTNKSDFKINNNGTYTKIQEILKSYQFFPKQFSTGGMGFVCFKKLITLQNGNPVNCGLGYYTGCVSYIDVGSYIWNNYEVVSGDNKIVTDNTIIYDQADANNSYTTFTKFTYDDILHLQVTQTETLNSKKESIISSFKYPYNFSTAPYTTMTANHIFNKTVEQKVINNTNPVFLQTNNFGSYNNNYLVSNIQLQTKSNPAETRANFNDYDIRGNVLEMQKTNDAKQSIIWDYNKIYPIAQVTDASQAEIAYTSFEADGKGNWNYSGIPALIANAITGKRGYNLSIGNIYGGNLSSSKTYIVSYWSRNGVQNVNNIGATSGITLNGWTYYEHTIINPSTGSANVSGSGIIDELRLYPLGAQMTTNTYEPLIGVIAQCDANNRLTYYEYDGMGRLGLIRDQYKNVLKKYCYNYAGQVENCNYYYNTSQSQAFTKSCTADATGSQVNYTVPANTYGSVISINDANAKALADINANGQSYANANGTCTSSSITVQGYNSKSTSYNLRLTDNNSGIAYYFYLNANTNSPYTLGQVPSGTYTVVFYPSGMPINCTYDINGFTYYGSGGTFNNISITALSTARMY